MPSLQARLVNFMLPLTGLKKLFRDPYPHEDTVAKLRSKGPAEPTAKQVKTYQITCDESRGFKVYTVNPPQKSNDNHILFLHGGGYVIDIDPLHWVFVCKLAKRSGSVITVPVYPLAPETKCAKLLEAMDGLYDDIYTSNDVTVMGDSAGAGLSLALTHKRRDAKKTLPNRLTLLSPWLDLTNDHPDRDRITPKDRVLSQHFLHACAELYRGDLQKTAPAPSPLFGQHHNLPPMQIFTGTHDLLYPDAWRLRDVMANQDSICDYYEYAGLPHDWMLMSMPETKDVFDKISTFLKA